jgi:hypothetical protein
MIDCPFEPVGEEVWLCPDCRRPYRGKIAPRRNCSGPAGHSPLATGHSPRPTPDLSDAAARLGVSLADVGHYAAALARWTAAGFPTRDAAEVARIEAEHCRPCTPHYRDGRCKKCGCRVNTSGLAVVNKIAMATEHCPLGKW